MSDKVNDLLRPFSELREIGLRVSSGIDTRGRDLEIRFESPAQLNNASLFLYKGVKIGMYSYMRSGTVRNVESIGRYCSIGPNVTLGEGEHPTNWLSTSPAQYLPEQFSWFRSEKQLSVKRRVPRTKHNDDGARGNLTIGNDVWIGGGATVRRGVSIGDGAIIGGNAFVTRDVEPYSIVIGLPAKHVRYRFPSEIVLRLLKLRWWRFDINDLAGVAFDDIEKALDEIELRERKGLIVPLESQHIEAVINSKGFLKKT